MSRIVAIALVLGLAGSAAAMTPGTDARAEIQAMIDATPSGGVLILPSGDYLVSRAGSAYWSLRIPAGVTVRGSGTILRQSPGTAAAVRMFQMDGAGAVLERITLDGNADALTASTQRHGAIVAAAGVTIRDVTARNFTGDGIYLYAGADGAVLDDVIATNNRRNGLTLGGQMTGIAIRGGTYANNVAQQIDSEPGAPYTVNDVTIADATIDTGASTQYAITVSGTGSASRSHDWRITGCVINGSVHVVWADDVTIASNTITNPTASPAVDIYRTSSRVVVVANTIAQTAPGLLNPSAVFALGTGTGQMPADVLVAANTITTVAASAFGVRAMGALSIAVLGNTIAGSGLPYVGAAGVYLRTTNNDVPMGLATVQGNTIAGYGQTGVSVAGNETATITVLRVIGNVIGDAGTAQSIGLTLDDGLHPVQHSDVIGNSYGSGVTAGRL